MNDIPKKRGPKPKNTAPINETSITDRMGNDTDGPNEPVMPARASRGIPPCPDADPSMGMKTPAVVAWWFEYHPKEAAAKYDGLTLPQLED